MIPIIWSGLICPQFWNWKFFDESRRNIYDEKHHVGEENHQYVIIHKLGRYGYHVFRKLKFPITITQLENLYKRVVKLLKLVILSKHMIQDSICYATRLIVEFPAHVFFGFIICCPLFVLKITKLIKYTVFRK